MTEPEAISTVTAYAICDNGMGCTLCPVYDANRSTEEQQNICSKSIDYSSLKSAIIALRGIEKRSSK